MSSGTTHRGVWESVLVTLLLAVTMSSAPASAALPPFSITGHNVRVTLTEPSNWVMAPANKISMNRVEIANLVRRGRRKFGLQLTHLSTNKLHDVLRCVASHGDSGD
jgi:hypothetical protein